MTTAKTYKAMLDHYEATRRQIEELQADWDRQENQILDAETELLQCNDCGGYGRLEHKGVQIVCDECGTSWGFDPPQPIMRKGLELVLTWCDHGFNYGWHDQHGAVRCSGWHEGTEQEATSQAIKHLNAPAN